eukprot:g6170.t1
MSDHLLFPWSKFPYKDLPYNLEQYYESTRSSRARDKLRAVQSREALIAALDSDEVLAEFWKQHYQTDSCPDEYFSSLLDNTKSYQKSKIIALYESYLILRRFSEISKREREKLQKDFEAVRLNLYQDFLKAESIRLGCDVSEVRPTIPVLPLRGNEGEFRMFDMSDDILLNIMTRLESIDIFRMTLVCKCWRQFALKYATAMTRAECSITTYLLSYKKWMDPSNLITSKDYISHFKSFGWSLLHWCCNISQNIETLILNEFDLPYEDIICLVKQCPNLKHLHFKFRDNGQISETSVHLPKLEALILERSVRKCSSKFIVDAFTNSQTLQAYKGRLMIGDLMNIEVKCPNQNPFSKLVALDLVSFSAEVLDKLAKLDSLKLRYLKLGDDSNLTNIGLHHQYMMDTLRRAFHNLLTRCCQLEVLISHLPKMMTNKTIDLLIDLQLPLKGAVFKLHAISSHNVEGFDAIDNPHYQFEHDVASLISLRDMLCGNDPDVDLSVFEIIVGNEAIRSELEKADTGFVISTTHSPLDKAPYNRGLKHPAMRRYLGIQF